VRTTFSAICRTSSGVTRFHAQNYVKMFPAIMALLGVDIPPLDGVVKLQFLMSKKHTLEMIECEEGLVDI
jgi:hypothetical protein